MKTEYGNHCISSEEIHFMKKKVFSTAYISGVLYDFIVIYYGTFLVLRELHVTTKNAADLLVKICIF